MNKLKNIVALAIIIATPVFSANEGLYTGVNLGNSNMGIDSSNGIDTKSGFAGGFLVGYQFSKNVAMEGQITTLGKVSDLAGGSVKANAASLTGVGFMPINTDISLYGKLGVAETKTLVYDSFPANNSSRFGITGGLGAQYAIPASPLAVRLGWDIYGVSTLDAFGNTTNANANANVVTLGAVYKF